MYICIYVERDVYIYIYTHRERERDRYMCIYMYTYIYIYIYMKIISGGILVTIHSDRYIDLAELFSPLKKTRVRQVV